MLSLGDGGAEEVTTSAAPELTNGDAASDAADESDYAVADAARQEVTSSEPVEAEEEPKVVEAEFIAPPPPTDQPEDEPVPEPLPEPEVLEAPPAEPEPVPEPEPEGTRRSHKALVAAPTKTWDGGANCRCFFNLVDFFAHI